MIPVLSNGRILMILFITSNSTTCMNLLLIPCLPFLAVILIPTVALKYLQKGLIITGGSDKIINVVDFDFDFVRTLIGHDGNVCCLDSRIIDGELIIISGSWDKSAIIWRNFEKTITLTGHEQAIWGVKVLQNGNFLTASADKTIKLWNGSNGVCLWTFEGHSDCVRGIQVAQDETKFYSVSNDASIKIWDMNGDCISTLYGHSSFIYALAVANDRIISVGEDKCIKVWDFKECIQTIPYPCDSIWCISISSDGDFLVGGSDGQLRVFSSNPIKIPSLEEQQKYSQAVASIQIQKYFFLLFS